MADKISTSTVLKVTTNYADTDTRIINVNNPKENLTLTAVKNAFDSNSNVFLSDKSDARYTGTTDAKIVTTTRTELDIR